MKNKVLVSVSVPEIDQNFDVYLPINKKVGNVINLLNKVISEMTDGEFVLANNNSLYNVSTKEKYQSDILLANTNIRNGTQLVLLSK
jgi:hypothetical protein